MTIVEFIFGDFWRFIGLMIALEITFEFILKLFKRNGGE